MNLLLAAEILGWLLAGLAATQAVPLVAACLFGDPWQPYAASVTVGLALGGPIAWFARTPDRVLRHRDAFLVVTSAWLVATISGALPYVFSGALGPIDALFESMSGFTTTGSTVVHDIEALPRALLLWRSLSQWLGGMGIIVFTVAVLPLLGIGGMQLFKAESPGPTTDKLTPRIADTARRLWMVYVGITVAAFISLRVAGMSSFDALCHAFTTLATGGFSTRAASIGAFGPAVQWVVTFFMLMAGINFVVHYRALTQRGAGVFRDGELRFYLGLAALATVLAAGLLWLHGGESPLRDSAFQVVSLLTTTGFATVDYETWPAFAQLLVMPLLLVGGMAGSTAGGIKSIRILLQWRSLRAALQRFVHPHAVAPVRYGDRLVPEEILAGIGVFMTGYMLTVAFGAAAVGLAGYDVLTAITAAATAVGNVGPGLGQVGPTDDFAHFPGAVKAVLVFCMLAGRLEIVTVLVLMTPSFWRR